MTHNPATDKPYDIIAESTFDTDMEFYTVMVNAEQAADLEMYNREPEVGKDATNRKASQVRIEDYAAEMLKDVWYLSAQPVILTEPDANGNIEMIDGQQRVKAIRKAAKIRPDIVVPLTICLNAPRKMMWVLDRGLSRKPADWMRMAGHANSTALSHSIRILYAIKELQPYRSITLWRSVKLSPEVEAAFLADHIQLKQGLDIARGTRSIVRAHVSAVLWYLMQEQYGPFKAQEFMTGLTTGADISDARLKVRELLSRRKWEKYPWDGFEQLGLLITAVNAWLLGDEKYRAGSAFTKASKVFPRLIPKSQLPDSLFTQTSLFNTNDESLMGDQEAS